MSPALEGGSFTTGPPGKSLPLNLSKVLDPALKFFSSFIEL